MNRLITYCKKFKLSSCIFKKKQEKDILDCPIKYEDTIKFVPPIKKGIVIKVYDGDTIIIASKLPYKDSPIYRFSVRLMGIDCPELKTKNESEKECAELAKKELTDLVMNKVVRLENIQTEKYGRILADVYLNDINLSKHMLNKGLAVAYDGGTKITPIDWKVYYNNWMEYYKDGINHK